MAQLPKNFLVSGALLSPRPGLFWVAGGDWKCEKSAPKSRPAFYAPDFFLSSSESWIVPTEWMEMSAEDLLDALSDESISDSEETTAHLIASWSGPEESRFNASFAELQRSFQAGQLKKAVPIVFERADGEMSPALLRKLLFNLISRPKGRNLRVYGIWGLLSGPFRGILGATPEDLFEIDSMGDVRTMALAGTRSKVSGSDLETEKALFLQDPKERREHQWVIDDIREALQGMGELRVHETEVVELPLLFHLKTKIELKPFEGSEEQRFDELVRRLHPTAALGAFPRQAGWEWLREQEERENRGRFGAPFGINWPGKGALCVVAIRNIQWGSQGLCLGSGCGVIEESVASREWQELALKRQSVKGLLGL